jgi:hypothetical protein
MQAMTTRQAVVSVLAAATVAATLALRVTAPSVAASAQIAQVRAVPAFDRVKVDGAFTITIAVGHPKSVTVSAPAGLADRVTTTVEGRTLIVGMKSGSNPFHASPNLAIALPALLGFENNGAGVVTIGGLSGGDLDLSNAGAASMTLTGRVARLTIALDGTGKIDAGALDAKDVTVENNGIGSIVVRASGALVMNVNGIGSIRYAGTPAHIESHVNGVGSIGRV